MKFKITFLVFSFAILAFSCTTKEGLDSADFPILTTAREIAAYYDIALDTSGNSEQTKLIKYFDLSVELDYTYELFETKDYLPLYYYITISQDRNAKEAKENFSIGKGSILLGAKIGNMQAIEIKDLILPGDDSYYAFLYAEGEKSGMLYTVRKGSRIYTIMISGIYTDDHSLLYDLILPKLSGLEHYDLKNAI